MPEASKAGIAVTLFFNVAVWVAPGIRDEYRPPLFLLTLVLLGAACLWWLKEFRASKTKPEQETTSDAFLEQREQVFRKCVAILNESLPVELAAEDGLPFNALARAEAYDLKRLEDLNYVCERLAQAHYGHPFAGMDCYVPDRERLKFLEWVCHHANYNARKGYDFLEAAEQWRSDHGYAVPPAKARLTTLFRKT